MCGTYGHITKFNSKPLKILTEWGRTTEKVAKHCSFNSTR